MEATTLRSKNGWSCNRMYDLDFSFLIPYVPLLAKAALVTVQLGVLSFAAALLIAVIVGAVRSFRLPWIVRFPFAAYVEIFRGTPLLVQLFFIYYGLPSFGIMMAPYPAAVLGLSLNSAAYMSEVVRASIASVERGQYEAAYTLGYSRPATMLHIILPQSFRIALPSFMNYFSTMLKETSLVSLLSIAETMRIGNQIYSTTLRPFEIYLTMGAMYFIMTYSVALLSGWLERRSSLWTK